MTGSQGCPRQQDRPQLEPPTQNNRGKTGQPGDIQVRQPRERQQRQSQQGAEYPKIRYSAVADGKGFEVDGIRVHVELPGHQMLGHRVESLAQQRGAEQIGAERLVLEELFQHEIPHGHEDQGGGREP